MGKEKAPYASLPKEIADLPHWTTHTNKRPHTPPNKWQEGKPLSTLLEDPNANNGPRNLGILVAPLPADPHLYIDIDYPGTPERKAALKKQLFEKHKADPTFLGSVEHNSLIQETWDSIASSEIPHLIPQTYTEYSPSLAGLRLIVKAEDKAAYGKATAKSKAGTFNGQVDFKNQFITITGLKLEQSPSTIAQVKVQDLVSFTSYKAKTGDSSTDTHTQGHTHAEMSLDDEVEATWATDVPDPAVMSHYLDSVTLDASPTNGKVHKEWTALTGQEYEHYNFWLSIGMALHAYSREKQCNAAAFNMFLQWSMTDKGHFKDEQDIIDKWSSFSTHDANDANLDITWRTLVKLANRCRFSYPRPIILKGKNTGRPMINEVENFEYLLDFYGLELLQGDGLYVRGDIRVLQQYFLKVRGVQLWPGGYVGPFSSEKPHDDLSAAVLRLCQDSHWRGMASGHSMVRHWVSTSKQEVDLVTAWLDTPFEELPDDLRLERGTDTELSAYNDRSNLGTIIECLNFDPNEDADTHLLYATLVKKWFLQFAKFRDPHLVDDTLQDNGGILILVGAEATYKTTFGKMLLPSIMGKFRKSENLTITSDKGMRDFTRNMGTKAIVQVDEFEGLMDMRKESSKFKNILSTNEMGFTDIYRSNDVAIRRNAVLLGTTNATKQVLSDDGTRRMWFVKVHQIDTLRLRKFNWHYFYNTMREELAHELNMFDQGYQKHVPWMLTQEEIVQLNGQNDRVAATSDLDMILEDIWPSYRMECEDLAGELQYLITETSSRISSTGTRGDGTGGEKHLTHMAKRGDNRLLTSLQVLKVIDDLIGDTTNVSNISRPSLERSLERHCGRWTGTLHHDRNVDKPKCLVSKGRAMQGMYKGRYKYKKWILPPMSSDFAEDIPTQQYSPEEEML